MMITGSILLDVASLLAFGWVGAILLLPVGQWISYKRDCKKHGKAQLFSTTISKEEYTRAYMKEVQNTFFGGSFASLVSFFAKDEQLSDEEVSEIMEILKNRKQ